MARDDIGTQRPAGVDQLRSAVRRACVELRAVIDAVERAGNPPPPYLVRNLRSQLGGLRIIERDMGAGPPSRRVWSLGQAAVPVVPTLLNGLTRRAPGIATEEIRRCRRSVAELSAALNTFAEGREPAGWMREGGPTQEPPSHV